MNNSYSEIRITRLDSMRLAGYQSFSENPEEQSIAYMNEWVAKNGLDKQAGSRNFGFDVRVSKEQAEQGIRGYEYWVTVPDTVVESDGVKIENFEADEYAVLRITNPFSNPFDLIPNAWKTLNDWVMGGEHKTTRFDGRHWLEEVTEIDGITYMDIYYPIGDGGKKVQAQLAGFKVETMEKCKVIGKAIQCSLGHPNGNPVPAFWGKCFEDGSMAILEAHADRIHSKATIGWMGDFDMEASTFTYIVGVLASANATVPDGMVSVDMQEYRYGIGTIEGVEPDLFMCAHDITETEIKKAGLKMNFDNYVEFEWYDERFCVTQGEKQIDLYIRIQ